MALRAAGQWREAAVPGEVAEGIRVDTRSNDYLGLASMGVSRETIPDGERIGAGAARLVSGTWAEHLALEDDLAEWLQQEACLLFSSGYAANVGTLSALAGPGETVFSDALNHASIIDGCRLSRADVVVLPHRSLEALTRALAASRGVRWVVTETYFGMDGDTPDLRGIRRVCDQYDAALIVDEAHALGVFGPGGRGLCAERGVVPDVLIGGIGKALGVQGGFVATTQLYRDWLWNRARSQVFSTATSPLMARMIRERVGIVRDAGALRAHLRSLEAVLEARLSAAGLSVPAGRHGPVFPIVTGGEAETMAAAAELRLRGVAAQPIRPPTVPTGASRLRVSLRANMSVVDVEFLAEAVVQVVRPSPPQVEAPVAGVARARRIESSPTQPPVSFKGCGAAVSSGSQIVGAPVGILAPDAGRSRDAQPPVSAEGRTRAAAGGTQFLAAPVGVLATDAERAPAAVVRTDQLRSAEALRGVSRAAHGSQHSMRDLGPVDRTTGADVRRWIVLGTGTGVGKTYVSRALIRHSAERGRAAGGLKPIETGVDGAHPESTDAGALGSTSFHVKHPANHPLYGFPDPVTPSLAARRSGITIHLPEIVRWVDSVRFTSEASAPRDLIIETAGGVFSPIGDGITNYDLALALGPSTWILVAPNRLGVLHDIGACLRALTALGRAPDALVLSAPPEPDSSTAHNADELRHQGLKLPIIELSRNDEASLAVLFEMEGPDARG